MSQQPYTPNPTSQADPVGGYSGQHDTTALPRVPQDSPGHGPGPGYAPGYGYTPGYAPINHEAAAWQERFRRQRTRTRIAVAFAALASATALVLGVATWQLASNPLFGSASDIASDLGSGDLNLNDRQPGDAAPQDGLPPGAAPQDGLPQDGQPDRTDPGAGIPLADLPLPDSLKSLATVLGITDVGQLLDLAVANGMMSQSEADQLLAALAATNT